MNTKELQPVTFEQAKRLKKSGFNRECDNLYVGEKRVRAGSEEFAVENPEGNLMTYSNWNDEGYEWNDGAEKEWISAPSVPLALKWFRDEKNLKNEVRFYYCSDSYETYYYQGFLDCKNYKQLLSTPHFDTYEAAESALLDELLTVLEKEKG